MSLKRQIESTMDVIPLVLVLVLIRDGAFFAIRLFIYGDAGNGIFPIACSAFTKVNDIIFTALFSIGGLWCGFLFAGDVEGCRKAVVVAGVQSDSVFAILIKDAAILVDDGYDIVIAELVIIVVITANAVWIDGCRAAIRFL